MRKIGYLATASLAAVVSFSSVAASPSWRFAEGGYTNAEAGRADFDGIHGAGTYLLDNNVFVTGEYRMLDDSGVDLDMLTLGAGYRMALTRTTDAYGTVNYERAELENNDESGYSVAAGIRHMVLSNVELLGEIGYYDVDDGDVTVKIGANYYLSPRWAIGASYEEIDDIDITQLTARYRF